MKLAILGIAIVVANGAAGANASLLVEPLHSIRLESDMLYFSVSSHGCTRADDFQLLVNRRSSITVSVIRVKKDRCRKAPTLLELSIKLSGSELNENKGIEIANPFQPFVKMDRR